jgi:lipoprotein-anchoring transpeptidase ErfK/SrfK
VAVAPDDHYLRPVGRRAQQIAAGMAASLLLVGACGGGSGDDAGGADESPTTEEAPGDAGAARVAQPTGSQVATAVPAQVQVYATAADTQPTTVLDNPNENGAPLVFLVKEDRGEWLEVHLPIRPNGSTGFVRATDVTVADNPYSIDVELAEHRLVVTKGDEVVADEPIGVGTATTPTPGGVYYIKELLQPPDPTGPYGPYAYGLSGFSNELEEFNGGEGVIGIHGTDEPELIGTDVSHGCIRMSNEAITRLAAELPLGTPVHITV